MVLEDDDVVFDRLRRWSRQGNLAAKVLAILLAIMMVTSVVIGILGFILGS